MLCKTIIAAEHLIDISKQTELINSSIKGTHLGTHTTPVSNISLGISQELGFCPTEQSLIYHASYNHDIGKGHQADEWIGSNKKLSNIQFDVVKMHPQMSHDIISTINIFSNKFKVDNLCISVADIILDHHERQDGTGYPNGKHGDEISIYAAIVSLADAFDAMTTDVRGFNQRNKSFEKVLERMGQCVDKQFDRRVWEAFLRYIEKAKAKGIEGVAIKEYVPDTIHINAIFTSNGHEGSIISETELFNFFEKIINKERKIAPVINYKKYIIEEEVQPYIFSQDGEPATRRIYTLENGRKEEVAEIIQQKHLILKDVLETELKLTDEDLNNCQHFLTTIVGFYKFTTLNHSVKEFSNILAETNISETKRKKILALWLKRKNTDIKITYSLLNKNIENKLLPLIDYIQKVNYRGIPYDKEKQLVALLGKELAWDEGKIEFMNRTIVLYHYLENILFLDESHTNVDATKLKNNIHFFLNKVTELKTNFTYLNKYLEVIIEKVHNDQRNMSEQAYVFMMIVKYSSLGGAISTFNKETYTSSLKNIFLKTLGANINTVNPQVRNLLKDLLG